MEVLEQAYAMERAGANVIHLEIGEPDFPAPPAAVEAARAALAAGATRYTDSRGLPGLRAAIAADKTRRTGVAVDPEQVLVTSGTSPALLLVFSLLLEPGDEVVVPAPHYACYPNFVRFCGGAPVAVPCDPASGWTVDPDAVRRALTPRTRAIVVGSPANPTGAVQPREVLAALAGCGVPLVSDEVYDGLVYDGAHATSALEVARDADVFVLDGFSKRYAMTGFRLGYALAPRRARSRSSRRISSSRPRSSYSTRASPRSSTASPPSRRCARPTRGGGICSSRGCARSASAWRPRRAAPSTCWPTRAASTPTRAVSPPASSKRRTSRSRPAWTSAPPARASCASATRTPTTRSAKRSRGWGACCETPLAPAQGQAREEAGHRHERDGGAHREVELPGEREAERAGRGAERDREPEARAVVRGPERGRRRGHHEQRLDQQHAHQPHADHHGEREQHEQQRVERADRVPVGARQLLVEGEEQLRAEGGGEAAAHHEREPAQHGELRRPDRQHVAEQVGEQVLLAAAARAREREAERHRAREEDADHGDLAEPARSAQRRDAERDGHAEGAAREERRDAEQQPERDAAHRGVRDADAHEGEPTQHHEEAERAAHHADPERRR